MNQSPSKQNQEDYYNISDLLNQNCMDYAKYVLTSRAIPDLRDGCKPIHRRIIWTFYKNKLTYDKNRVKSVNACGGVLQYSPHGDASVYDACVRLANDSVMLNLIDGKGSFSSTTSRDVQAGASRYTEMRLSKITTELLKGIDDDVVDMVLNYDETKYEPTVLPSTFPLILCNPNQGIGVGLSSNICSFNINQVCDYTSDTLNGLNTDPLIPDFPTGGGIIFDNETLNSIDSTGRGGIKLRAKYHIEENSIVITEIPYTTTREAIIEKVVDLVKQGKIKDIVDINDYTGINGLNITIDLKRNTNPELLMNKLYKLTPLQDTFSCNFNVLINGKPQVLGVKSITNEWIKFRKQCINRELQYDITQLLTEQEKLNGLAIILNDLDKAISLIRNSRTEKEAMDKLVDHFKLTQPMATYISSIRMVNMNEEWLTKQTDKLTKVNQELKANQENLSNDSYYTNRIISELEYIKKTYGQPRKTEIIHEVDDIKEVSLVPEENCSVCITKEGYCKLTQRRSDTHKLKDGDSIILNENTTNKSTVLLFTSLGNCYKVYLDELDYTLPSNLGAYLPSQLQFDKDEATTSAVVTRDYKGHLINVFEDNRLAKITLESFKTAQRRGVLKNSINTDSKLLYQTVIAKEVDLLVQSTLDKVLIVSTSDFNAKGSKNTAGDGLIKAKNNSVVKSAYPLTELNLDCIDVDYYKGKRNSVGCYLKKTDEIKENKQ